MRDTTASKVPPQNIEAELSLLGAILIDNQALLKVVEILDADDFYKESHRQIYRIILDLFQKGEPIDLITVTNSLKTANLLNSVGGAAYLAGLVDQLPTAANVGAYARIIREKGVLRKLISGAGDIVESALGGEGEVDDFVDQAERIIFDIAQKRMKRSFYAVKDLVKEAYKNFEVLHERKDPITGVATHFKDLDHITAGFQNSDLIILAGRPSMGKTALALNIALNAAKKLASQGEKKAVAVFSLEMSKEQVVQRLFFAEAEVEFGRLRAGILSEEDWRRLQRAAGFLYTVPLYIDDSPAQTSLEVRAKARRLQKERGLGLVVIDYLQLMRSTRNLNSREQEISEISRSLKELAKELRIPVVALSQLNRSLEMRQNKRPQLSDLRESGAIEQDADVIAFVYRDEVYNEATEEKGVAEIIIGKQRNGPTGVVKLKFFKEFTRFRDLDRIHEGMIQPFNPATDEEELKPF